MRERLIELIEQMQVYGVDQEQPKEHEISLIDNDILADHLLANGVIVPPVALGSRQKVYIPIRGTTVIYDTKVYGIGIDEDGDVVINPKEYPEDAISINCFNLGKTVFLSREEAEKALKERSGE